MQVIPVIDIHTGQVVHAKGGDRAAYRPIRTPLAAGSDPVAVARGFCDLFSFRKLYIADLAGIAGEGRDLETRTRLEAALPDLDLWVDDGARTSDDVRALLAESRSVAVIGSETWQEASALAALAAAAPQRVALSLDFRGGSFLGAEALISRPELWPEKVIVMALGCVGREAGPDLERVRRIAALAGPRRKVYAAGGVRGPHDLTALQHAGAAGALVATALHAGKIKAGDLQRIAGP